MSANDRQVGGDHYLNMGVEPWDVINTWSPAERIGFFRGNAIKYLMRMGNKGAAIEDVRKAQHYLDKLVEMLDVEGLA